MKALKFHILLAIVLAGQLLSAQVQSFYDFVGKDFNLNRADFPTVASFRFTARDYVRLSDGFEFVSGENHEFTARIDKDLVVPMQLENYSDVDGSRELDRTLAVGTTKGVFNVSQTGAATYNIPLELPKGSAGFEPQISIVYSSQAGNSTLGTGWNLSCYSAITRTGHNQYFDNDIRGVKFDIYDRFAYDGSRLIVTPGVIYGNDGVKYHTEQESFQQITSIGYAGNGPDHFIVETTDGKTLEYGNSPNSRIEAQGRNEVLVWLISKVTDLTGNYIEYEYFEDEVSGEYYIKEIKYTGNAQAGIEPFCAVRFYYSNRASAIQGYLNGAKHQICGLLTKIETYTDNCLLKKYEIKYNINDQIKEVFEYGNNGERYNSLVFDYGEDQSTIAHLMDGSYIIDYEPFGIIPGDYNGDGYQDFFSYDTEGNSFLAKSISDDGSSQVSMIQLPMFDANVIGFANPVLDTIRKDSPYLTYFNNSIYSTPGDINNDRKTDLITFTFMDDVQVSGGPVCDYYTYDIKSFSEITNSFEVIASITSIQKYNSVLPSPPKVLIADFNKDAILDVFFSYNDPSGYLKWKIMFTQISDIGAISFTEYEYNAPDLGFYSRYLLSITDINGDNIPEISAFGGDDNHWVICQYNTSLQFFEILTKINLDYTNYYDPYPIQGDFNGDGNTDFLVRGSNDWKIITSKGKLKGSFNYPASIDDIFVLHDQIVLEEDDIIPGPSKFQSMLISDMNFDGLDDILVVEDYSPAFFHCFAYLVKTITSNNIDFAILGHGTLIKNETSKISVCDLDADGSLEFICSVSSTDDNGITNTGFTSC
ncbi:MAG: hypothetical protein KKD31_16730, partial [Bacteroidetes bacterium]|nr:hypothetical protein [Bacteroidota bacterium]